MQRKVLAVAGLLTGEPSHRSFGRPPGALHARKCDSARARCAIVQFAIAGSSALTPQLRKKNGANAQLHTWHLPHKLQLPCNPDRSGQLTKATHDLPACEIKR